MKRRSWTAKDIRTLKRLAGKRTRAAKIARALRRTEGRRGKRLLVLDYHSKRVLQESDTKDWSDLKNGPALNHEGSEGQGRIHKPTRPRSWARTPNKYHAMQFLTQPISFPLLFHWFSTGTYTGPHVCATWVYVKTKANRVRSRL
jgi:hypothetical protein